MLYPARMETVKGISEFLKGVATAASTLATAVERLEKEMKDAGAAGAAGAAAQARSGTKWPSVKPVSTPTDTDCIQWIRKNARPGSSWDQALADYIVHKDGAALRPELKGPAAYRKPGDTSDPLPDLVAAEQEDLAKDSAEYGKSTPFLEGVNKEEILIQSGRQPVWGVSDIEFKEHQLAKEMKERRLDRNVPVSAPAASAPTGPFEIEVFNDILSTGCAFQMGKPVEPRAGNPTITKVVFVGASMSGKSRALATLMGKESAENTPTIGVNFDVYTNAKGRKIQIWDTAADPRFRIKTPICTKTSEHYIVFSDNFFQQRHLSDFEPGTHFKRFTTQENLKAYLDSL